MKVAKIAGFFLSVLAVGLTFGFAVELDDPVVLHSDALDWETLPSGVERAVLYGDPDAPGPFVLRLRYPAGYSKSPHHHPGDAYITILRGGYFRGYGARFDKSKAHALVEGTFSVNPAGVNHYEWTTEPAELQIQATGPWGSTYVDERGHPTP